MNTGQIIKSRSTNKYTALSNSLIQSKDLSFGEKGLLFYLLSLPDDWVLYKSNLHVITNEKKGTVDTLFRGLQSKGYILSAKVMDEKGQFKGWNHMVYDEAILPDVNESRSRLKPKSVIADVGKSAPIQRNNIIGLQSIESDNKYISIVDATASEIDVPVKTAKSSKPPLPAQPEYSSEFEKFWKAYDKPEAGGKKQSYEKWKKLTKETHDLILLYVNWYTKQQPDKQYRKNPITFFNQQPWIDFKPESEKQRTNATNFDTRTLFGELA